MRATFKTKGAQQMNDFAEMIGLVGDVAEQVAMSQRVGGDFESKKRNFQMKRFFRNIGLTQITHGQMAAVAKIGQFTVNKWARNVASNTDKKNSSSFLIEELGVPKDKVEAFSKWVTGSGGKSISNELVMGSSEMSQLYRTAIRRFVHTTIQVPTAATRQRYSSTPLGQFVYGLTSFINAFGKNVLIRNMRIGKEAFAKGKGYTNADRAAYLSQAMMLPVVLAVAGLWGELKDEILGNSNQKSKKQDDTKKAIKFLANSNAPGGITPFMNALVSVGYGRDALMSIQGPTASSVSGLLKATYNAAAYAGGRHKGNSANRELVKQLYGTVMAPMMTNIISTYTPYALPAAVAIQAINLPHVKRAVVDTIAGKKRRPR